MQRKFAATVMLVAGSWVAIGSLADTGFTPAQINEFVAPPAYQVEQESLSPAPVLVADDFNYDQFPATAAGPKLWEAVPQVEVPVWDYWEDQN